MRASPRSYARFTELPPGAIQPEGWLRQYARKSTPTAGSCATRKCAIPSSTQIFWDRVASLEGYWDSSCDFAGYFADGLVRYAQLVPESDLAAELDEWLGRVLASQDPDGYLGPFEPDCPQYPDPRSLHDRHPGRSPAPALRIHGRPRDPARRRTRDACPGEALARRRRSFRRAFLSAARDLCHSRGHAALQAHGQTRVLPHLCA